jgi:hypothetical protein
MKILRSNPFYGTSSMDLDVTQEQLDRWQSGELIQDVMSHLSPEEREFLISGFTPEQWKETFGDKS